MSNNESPPAAERQPLPGATAPGSFTGHQAGSGDAVAVRFSSPDPDTKTLAGCTGVARVGICIRCDRLYLGGPQIAPPAKKDAARVYHCEAFVTNAARLAEVKENA